MTEECPRKNLGPFRGQRCHFRPRYNLGPCLLNYDDLTNMLNSVDIDSDNIEDVLDTFRQKTYVGEVCWCGKFVKVNDG